MLSNADNSFVFLFGWFLTNLRSVKKVFHPGRDKTVNPNGIRFTNKKILLR
ncbi:hypothetical protein bcgnr5381_55780 [Bacillus cereus]